MTRLEFYAEYRRRVDAVLSELANIEAWWRQLDEEGNFDEPIRTRTNESQNTHPNPTDSD